MIKLIRKVLIPVLILAIGVFLRTNSLANHAPFDWDQNRDYQEVAKIASGKPTLIGPVAKGEGGFFLGPLYYYLLIPFYSVTGGNPISLPLTSVFIDTLTIAAIVGLGVFLKKPSFGYIFALLWAVSPSTIDSARISWNVILVPLWFIGMVYYLSKPKYANFELFFVGVISGLAWHIHAAIIPLAPILLLLRYRSLSLFSPKLFYLLTGYLIPLSPLILFDLRHIGLQFNLIKQMVLNQESVRQPILDVTYSTLSRYGKNLAVFFGGKSDLNLILGVFASLGAALMLFSKSSFLRLAVTSILVNLILVVLLGAVIFPEYYLLVATTATVLIFSYLLSKLRLGLLFATVLSLYLLTTINSSPTPYSLENKLKLARRIAQESSEAKIIYDLPFGRESGITILLKREGVEIKDNSRFIFMISEKNDQSLFINGKIATELGSFGALRLVKYEIE
ncbi:MAG: hypothetical protein Fur0011_6060 [Candidatus Microgenomates bacterium]